MPKCSNCGKTYSMWTVVVGSKLCPECRKLEGPSRSEAQSLGLRRGNAFHCQFHQLDNGGLGEAVAGLADVFGMALHTWHSGVVKLDQEALTIYERDAQAQLRVAKEAPLAAVRDVSCRVWRRRTQMDRAVLRGFVIGGLIGAIVGFRTLFQWIPRFEGNESKFIGMAVTGAVVGGAAWAMLSVLLSFASSEGRREMIEIQFELDDTDFVVYVLPAAKDKALAVLRRAQLL